MTTAPKSLIINSPYDPPQQHWIKENNKPLRIIEGRRPAGYEIIDTRNNTTRSERIELVNNIRPRVDEWREAGYPGVTSLTRQLLEYWHERGEFMDGEWQNGPRPYPFYFCQLEAMETLIWWVEGSP